MTDFSSAIDLTEFAIAPQPEPILTKRYGQIIGGGLTSNEEGTPGIVFALDIGDRTVTAAMGPETIDTILASIGQRNGMVEIGLVEGASSASTFIIQAVKAQ